MRGNTKQKPNSIIIIIIIFTQTNLRNTNKTVNKDTLKSIRCCSNKEDDKLYVNNINKKGFSN